MSSKSRMYDVAIAIAFGLSIAFALITNSTTKSWVTKVNHEHFGYEGDGVFFITTDVDGVGGIESEQLARELEGLKYSVAYERDGEHPIVSIIDPQGKFKDFDGNPYIELLSEDTGYEYIYDSDINPALAEQIVVSEVVAKGIEKRINTMPFYAYPKIITLPKHHELSYGYYYFAEDLNQEEINSLIKLFGDNGVDVIHGDPVAKPSIIELLLFSRVSRVILPAWLLSIFIFIKSSLMFVNTNMQMIKVICAYGAKGLQAAWVVINKKKLVIISAPILGIALSWAAQNALGLDSTLINQDYIGLILSYMACFFLILILSIKIVIKRR